MRNMLLYIRTKQMIKQKKEIIIKNQVMWMEHKSIKILTFQINLDNKNNQRSLIIIIYLINNRNQ